MKPQLANYRLLPLECSELIPCGTLKEGDKLYFQGHVLMI